MALPGATREVEPAFEHHATVPSLELEGGRASVILGRLAGVTAPGRTYSPLVGAEIRAKPEGRVAVPLESGVEHALVLLEGECRLDGQELVGDTLYYLGSGRRDLVLAAEAAGLRALLLGGAPFEETILMWWNFVARTGDEIVAAREDWQAGRGFGEVLAHAGPRLAAPPMLGRPATAG